MVNKVKKKWDSLSNGVQKVAKLLGAIATIVGVISASGVWITAQVDNSISTHIATQTEEIKQNIDYLFQKTDAHESQAELAITRIELLMLMQTNPTNITEIERVAKHYFKILNGNYYMSGVYADYCKKYGADCHIAE